MGISTKRLHAALLALGSLCLLQGCSEDKFKIAVDKKGAPSTVQLTTEAPQPSAETSSAQTSEANSSVSSSAVSSSPTNSSVSSSPANSSSAISSSANSVQSATESFTFSPDTSLKKIDFLFVVDNSPSMGPYQSALASGFSDFANTYFKNEKLDICLMAISTDRYLGVSTTQNGVTYSRERNFGCTRSGATYSRLTTTAEKNAYITNLISQFVTGINFGTNGSPTELAGKSLATFLNGQSTWSNTLINPPAPTPFFRTNSVANITFITDEAGNYLSSNLEKANDLPAVQNSVFPGTSIVDSRFGIKNYIERYFSTINPNHGYSYSITAFLESVTTVTDKSIEGPAANLVSLVSAVGGDSRRAEIKSSASGYSSVYADIGNALINRTNAYHLLHNYNPAIPPVVKLIRGGTSTVLAATTDYVLLAPNGVELTQARVATLQAGDVIEIRYNY